MCIARAGNVAALVRRSPGRRRRQREAAIDDDPIGAAELARQSSNVDEWIRCHRGIVASRGRLRAAGAKICRANLSSGSRSLADDHRRHQARRRLQRPRAREARRLRHGDRRAQDEHQPLRRDRARGSLAPQRVGRVRARRARRRSAPSKRSNSCARGWRWAPIARSASTRRPTLEPLTVARALHARRCCASRPASSLLGKQAVDDDHGQTGQMLAALWGRPQATFASALAVAGNVATVTREIDAGLETIEVDLPAVVTTDLRLNQPRYVKLPEILKAKSKPLAVLPLAELGVEPRGSSPCTTSRRRRRAPAACASRTSPSSSPRSMRAECCREPRARRRRARRLAARSRDGEVRALRARSEARGARRRRARAWRRRRRRASRAPRRRHGGRARRRSRTTRRRSQPFSRRSSRAWPRASRTCSARRRRSARICCRALRRCSASGRSATCSPSSGSHRFRRPVHAGNAVVTVDADPERLVVATVRLASYAGVGRRAAGARSSSAPSTSRCRATRASWRGAPAAARGRI